MKYIKAYKLFEANGPLDPGNWSWTKDLTIPRDMQMDIYDMSFELRDDGYSVTYQWWPPYEKGNKLYKDNKYPHINITKRADAEGGLEKIYYGWIEDFCQRIVSYLDEKEYNAVIKYRKLNSNEYFDIKDSVMGWGPFGDKPMVNSIHFRIEMISRRVYGDVYESIDSNVKSDVEDICLELMDNGFNIKTSTDGKFLPQGVNIDISNGNQFFYLDDISDVLLRLNDYANQMNKSFSVSLIRWYRRDYPIIFKYGRTNLNKWWSNELIEEMSFEDFIKGFANDFHRLYVKPYTKSTNNKEELSKVNVYISNNNVNESTDVDAIISRESRTRTKSLSEEEFLEIIRTNCKNFSFMNDLLWRKSNKDFGQLGLFLESERKATIGKYNYHTFFDLRKEYPVPRYKSLIGSTTEKGAEYFGSDTDLYMVIPFDNSQIVFAGSPDLALWSKTKEDFSDRLFIMKEYTKNFEVPVDELTKIRDASTLSSWSKKLPEFGFEFFISSPCLLIHKSKVNWLRNNL